jgi:hypothetical protein
MNNDEFKNREIIIMADLHINKNNNKGWQFKWTQEEDDLIIKYYQSNGYEKLLDLLPNRNKQGIQSRAFKLGVKYLSYNKEYFKKIDSSTKAYWLGFLYADGYTTNDDRWGLEIKYDDKEHLENMLNEIEYTGSPKERNRNGVMSCCFLIKNKTMTESLISLGVVPNKTELLSFPSTEVLSDKFYPDFIRGFFDGDGCISYNYITKPRKDRGNKIYTSLRKEINIVCKSNDFIMEMLNVLKRNGINLNWNVNKRDNNLNVIKTSSMSEIEKFYNYIYENSNPSNRLKRKHEKFISLFEGRCA